MYLVELMPKAIKDLKNIPKPQARKIVDKIQVLENGLTGNIKKLTNFSPEYRLRIGNYRVLFEIEDHTILIYRVLHRKTAYTQR
ncbi:Plasmid stabilisation system protein [Candidatus Venteria ishoeyi]|uniref:Plasmid stabilisation system protein n=2 Tax=Candidatus Venteria ishoeyi TaxID=1899563 RepID=A0A1H6FFE3_9GAMM|nr:Plasmid stabilisation system protein [Candidatus Venteria ishoeyi]